MQTNQVKDLAMLTLTDTLRKNHAVICADFADDLSWM